MNRESEPEEVESQSHADQLNEEINDGGGCAEAWEATSESRADGCNQGCTSQSRRSLLRTGVISTVILSLLPQFAQNTLARATNNPTKKELRRAESNYIESGNHREDVTQHAGALISTLREQDVISGVDTDELLQELTAWHSTSDTQSESVPPAVAYAMTERNTTDIFVGVQLLLTQWSERKEVVVHIRPQLNDSYALLTDREGDTRYLTQETSEEIGNNSSILSSTVEGLADDEVVTAATCCLSGDSCHYSPCDCHRYNVKCCGCDCVYEVLDQCDPPQCNGCVTTPNPCDDYPCTCC